MLDPAPEVSPKKIPYQKFAIECKLWSSPESVDELLNKGVDEFNNSVLFYLMKSPRQDTKEFLEKASREALSFACLSDPYALYTAVNVQNPEIFLQLIRKLSRKAISTVINEQDGLRDPILHLAIHKCPSHTLKIFIDKIDLPTKNLELALQTRDWWGWSFLHYLACDDKESKKLLFVINKLNITTIHKVLAASLLYKKTMLNIKKNNNFNFACLVLIQMFSYLACSHPEGNFGEEKKEWLTLFSELCNTNRNDYFQIIQNHIGKDSNFWKVTYRVTYQDIRNLLLKLHDIDSNIIKEAIDQCIIFLTNKIEIISDPNVREIVLSYPKPVDNRIIGNDTIDWDKRKHSYVEAMELFGVDSKLLKDLKQNTEFKKNQKSKEKIESSDEERDSHKVSSIGQKKGKENDDEDENGNTYLSIINTARKK